MPGISITLPGLTMSKLLQIVSDGFRAMTGQQMLRSIGGVPIINIRQDRRYTQEQMRVYAGPGGYLRSGPFAQNWTQETADMRISYRKALAEPSVKAALVGKVTNVCSLGPQMTPAVKSNPLAQEHADFCKHAIIHSKRGFFGIGWEILWHGCMEGWSICEPVWKEETRGRFRGKVTLEEVKAKDTKFIMPILDPFLNITGLFNNHANYARMFDPSGFIIYSHLRMFGNPHGVSDLRAAYRAMLMIPDIIRMRMVFLDKYVGPFLAGAISAPEMKASMYNELKKSRQSGVLVYDKDSDVKILDLATRGTADFQAALQDLRQEVATGISGAFLHMMTGETPGARGDSQVQKDTVDLFVWMLAEQLSILINQTLVPWLMEMNYGAQYDLPIFSLEAVSPADIVADLAIDESLDRMGIPTSVGEILERARRSPPRNGDENDNTQLVKAKAQQSANPQPPAGAGNPPFPNGNGQSANPFLSQGALGFGELPNGHSVIIAPEAVISRLGNTSHLSIESYLADAEGQAYDSFAEAVKFTGTKKDRLGREYYYVNGVRTSKEHLESGDKSKGFAKKATANPADRQAAIDHVAHHFQNPHELTDQTMVGMPHVMALMTVPQLKALKAQYGVTGGKRKDHYIELIRAKLAKEKDIVPQFVEDKPPAPTQDQLAGAAPKPQPAPQTAGSVSDPATHEEATFKDNGGKVKGASAYKDLAESSKQWKKDNPFWNKVPGAEMPGVINPVCPDQSRPTVMSARQAGHLNNYTWGYDGDLNIALRNTGQPPPGDFGGSDVGKPPKNGPAMMADLMDMFDRAKPFRPPVTVFRGIRFISKDDHDAILSAAEAARDSGGIATMPGFASTTPHKDTAEGFASGGNSIQFEIKAIHGLDMLPYSHFPGEYEMLLQHNSRYKVTKVERGPYGKAKIYLEQVYPAGAASHTLSGKPKTTMPTKSQPG